MAQSSNIIHGAFRDPKTKEDLLDRMMRRDFSGDLADLAENRNLQMERIRPHVIRLTFGASGKTFDLTVHKPRPAESGKPVRQKARAAPAAGSGEVVGGQRQQRNRGGRNKQQASNDGGQAQH